MRRRATGSARVRRVSSPAHLDQTAGGGFIVEGNVVPMAQPGMRALFSGEYTARSIAIAGGTVLHAVNVLIAITILPSVVNDIGGQNLYAWNTTLYVVASIIGAALAPRVLVRLGPRVAFRVAVVCFIVGGLLCALAPAMVVLLIGRTVQGFGGGFLSALIYAIIREAYPQPLWPRAFALSSAMWGIATVSGPTIGGIFGELGAWRWAFGSILPVAVLILLLFERILRDIHAPAMTLTRLPVRQLGLLAGSVMAISAGSISDDALTNALGIGVAVVLLVALARTERRSANRLLPTGTFSLRTPIGAILTTIVLLMIAISAEVFTPYFLQLLHGLSPLVAGYMVALLSAGWTISSITVSSFQGNRERMVILYAPLVILAGLGVMALSMPDEGGGAVQITVIGVGLFLLGLGIGSTFPHLLTRALSSAPKHEQALTASSMTTVQLVATAFGAAIGGVITNLNDYSNLQGGGTTTAAAWYFGLFCLAPALAFLTAILVVRKAPAAVPAAEPATSP